MIRIEDLTQEMAPLQMSAIDGGYQKIEWTWTDGAYIEPDVPRFPM